MEILLANPNSSSAYLTFGCIFPPLGLLYVAASAEEAGHHVAMEDFCLTKQDPSNYNFKGKDVVGITMDARRYPGALDVAAAARKAGATIVMGGPLPAYIDDDLLRDGHADFIVRGEGERTFPELLKTLSNGGDPRDVTGISFLRDNGIVRTGTRALISDLDTLPLPARHLIDLEAYKKAGFKIGGTRPVTVISTSRGCSLLRTASQTLSILQPPSHS